MRRCQPRWLLSRRCRSCHSRQVQVGLLRGVDVVSERGGLALAISKRQKWCDPKHCDAEAQLMSRINVYDRVLTIAESLKPGPLVGG
jgi:hypothetical protein